MRLGRGPAGEKAPPQGEGAGGRDKKGVKASGKPMRSMARRIHRAWSRKLLRTYLLTDLLVLALALYGFCFFVETQALGSFALDRPRQLWVPEQSLAFWRWAQEQEGLNRVWALFRPSAGRQAAHSALYRFAGPEGAWLEAPLGPFLTALEAAMGPLLLIQLVLWLAGRLWGGGYARRALNPIIQITQTAQRLSARPDPPPPRRDDQLHHLEDAIQSLTPERQGVKLSTGDKELKGLEEAINSLLERMRAAYAQQARFVSDASHELRTPIAVIQGYANMLDRWGKQDESILDESIAAIKAESAHMKDLVEQLLFLARGDSGRQALNPAPFDLGEMMREVHEEYAMIDRAHQWRIHIDPGLRCVGDEGLIKQTARILADNAVKYTPAGGVIWLRAFAQPGEVCFWVQDSGIGISPDQAPHIFERFYRADAARSSQDRSSPRAAGTGLGLSIAQWIVSSHGGYFLVKSWTDLGTRITVCLPQEPAAQDAAP